MKNPLHKLLCYFSHHKWEYSIEEISRQDYIKKYWNFPTESPIYSKVRICQHCYKKQEYKHSIMPSIPTFWYWEDIELNKIDIRDRTLNKILND